MLWFRQNGTRIAIAKFAIDTGYEAPAVYAWARRAGHAQVAPIKGVEGFNRAAPVAGPSFVDVNEGGKKLRRGARLTEYTTRVTPSGRTIREKKTVCRGRGRRDRDD